MKAIYTLLFSLCFSAARAQVRDSVLLDNSAELGNKFTLEIKNVRFDTPETSLKIVIRHSYNAQPVGCDLLISPTRISGSSSVTTALLADDLFATQVPHTYTVTSNNIQLSVYRDNVLLGKIYEGSTNDAAGISLVHDRTAVAYETAVTPLEVIEPVESDLETHIENMLPSSCPNLIADPYCNRGFTRTGENAGERVFFSQQAIYSGWGSEAGIDNEQAWSGANSLRISGQAIRPSRGASVEVGIKFEANTPYFIRAMVKSDGYEGKIGIQSCKSYIHIRDTKGEWKQVEGVITPVEASELLYINNADFDNSGTVWIDNLEVYKGYTSTASIGVRKEVPYVALAAGEHWSPTRATNVYMLGFTDEGEKYSTIDPKRVTLKGGARLTRNVSGSQMYALSFPGPLCNAHVSGWFDGVKHEEEPLYPGVDFVLQRYEYPRFQYVDGEDIPAGCYIIQFVDNLDGQKVTMTFGTPPASTDETSSPYRFTGNNTGTDYAPEGTFLKFSEERMKFERTRAESVRPFEAYIATTADAPVSQIVPNGTLTTGLSRIEAADGTRVNVQGCRDGIVAHAAQPCRLSVYTLDGRMCCRQELQAGRNLIRIPAGLYIAGGKKIIVSR